MFKNNLSLPFLSLEFQPAMRALLASPSRSKMSNCHCCLSVRIRYQTLSFLSKLPKEDQYNWPSICLSVHSYVWIHGYVVICRSHQEHHYTF